MPFYPICPTSLRELYFDACRMHNQELSAERRYEIVLRGNAILDCVRALYGDVTTGRLIIAADNEFMEGERLICGGMFLDVDQHFSAQIEAEERAERTASAVSP